jgi:hypothetical protein
MGSINYTLVTRVRSTTNYEGDDDEFEVEMVLMLRLMMMVL